MTLSPTSAAFVPGAPISARDLAALAEEVRAARRVRGAGGVVVSVGAGGVEISLAGGPPPMMIGVVASSSVPGPALPSEIEYTISVVWPIRETSVVRRTVLPGARDDEIEVWPAPPGTPCILVRVADGPTGYAVRPLIFGEVPAYDECPPPEGGLGERVQALAAEIASLRTETAALRADLRAARTSRRHAAGARP